MSKRRRGWSTVVLIWGSGWTQRFTLTLIRLNLDKKMPLTMLFSHKHTQGHINTHTHTLALKTHFWKSRLESNLLCILCTLCNSFFSPTFSLSLFSSLAPLHTFLTLVAGDFAKVVELRLKHTPLLIHSSADQLFNRERGQTEVENKKKGGDGG